MIILNNAHAACSKDMQPFACISFSCMYTTDTPITVASYCMHPSRLVAYFCMQYTLLL